MTDAVDWTDPCARAAALRNAYYSLVSGDREQEIRTRTLDAEETVKFQPGNIDALRSELQDAEQECLAKSNPASLAGRRFAITLRHKRRHRGPFGWPYQDPFCR